MILLALAATIAATAQPTFVEKLCAESALAKLARCGTVEVPEDRTLQGGRRLQLNVMVFPATAGKAVLPPLFDIDGGPGLPDTKNAGFYATVGSAYRARRDVVLVDQRGTGGSNPLSCPELASAEVAYKPLYSRDAVARCRKLLEAKADLKLYLTHQAVADLDAVRAALGYNKIDLFGLSYGTTVALRYLATYPQRVRAAVLLSVAPPSAMPPASHAPAAQRALDLLFAECAAELACRKAFDPPNDLDRALQRLSADKASLPGEIFLEKLRSLMYQPSTSRRIPWIINRAASGNLKPFYDSTFPRGTSPYYDGVFLSVTCSEGLALMNFQAAVAKARATRFGDYRLQRQRKACDEWPKGEAAADFLGPVNSPASVLLISGGMDPVTPPQWAEAVAKSLRHARLVAIPASGHVFDGLSGIDTCFDPLVLKFLDTGDLREIDPACLDKMQPPPFTTSDPATAAGQ